MSLTLTVSGARRIRFDFPAAARAWSSAAGPVAENLVKANAPFFSGKLRQSVRRRDEASAESHSVIIYGTVSYLPFVLGGTRAHVIAARNAKALRWMGKGGIGVNFARSVNHPGTRANPFPERALSGFGPLCARMFADAVRGALVIE